MQKYPKVIFIDEDHSYWYGEGSLEDGKRERLISVNRLWSKYRKPFPEEMAKAASALSLIHGGSIWPIYFKYIKDGDTLDTFKKVFKDYIDDRFDIYFQAMDLSWELDRHDGTNFHNMLEEKDKLNGWCINPLNNKKVKVHDIKKEYDNQSVVDDLSKLEDGCYPELVVWDEKSKTCGQIDKPIIETIKGKRYVDIIDYKTNGGKTLEKGLKKREEILNEKGNDFMKEPLNHLKDCKRTGYQGQLSLYARLLEKAGFIPRNLAVAHYLQYDPNTEMIIPFNYLKEECIKIIG